MGAYCAKVRKLEKYFQGQEIHHVLRDSNVAADILAKLGSDRVKVPPDVFVQELNEPSIKQLEEAPTSDATSIQQVLMITKSWTQPMIDYIKDNKLPGDKKEATQVLQRSKNYIHLGEKLYKRSASSGVLLKCVSYEERRQILQEIHLGCC